MGVKKKVSLMHLYLLAVGRGFIFSIEMFPSESTWFSTVQKVSSLLKQKVNLYSGVKKVLGLLALVPDSLLNAAYI